MGTIEEPINNSKGCGTVMRVAPVGLIGVDDPFLLGAEISATTHGHPSGYWAGGATALIVDRVFNGVELDAALGLALE